MGREGLVTGVAMALLGTSLTTARPALAGEVAFVFDGCEDLESLPELRSHFEARALIELSVGAAEGVTLVVKCGTTSTELLLLRSELTPISRVLPTEPPSPAWIDQLMNEVWQLRQAAEREGTGPLARENAPAEPSATTTPTDAIEQDSRKNAPSRGPSSLIGVRVGGEVWSRSAVGTLALSFAVEASETWGGALRLGTGLPSTTPPAISLVLPFVELELWRRLGSWPLEASLGVRGSFLSVATETLTPTTSTTSPGLAVSGALRYRFDLDPWLLRFGAAALVTPLRSRVFVDESVTFEQPLMTASLFVDVALRL